MISYYQHGTGTSNCSKIITILYMFLISITGLLMPIDLLAMAVGLFSGLTTAFLVGVLLFLFKGFNITMIFCKGCGKSLISIKAFYITILTSIIVMLLLTVFLILEMLKFTNNDIKKTLSNPMIVEMVPIIFANILAMIDALIYGSEKKPYYRMVPMVSYQFPVLQYP